MPSTLTHAILPASCAVFRRSKLAVLDRVETFKFAVIAAVVGNLPDLDIIPAVFMPLHWKAFHRYWGHNLFSLMVWMLVGTYLMKRWVNPKKIDWKSAAIFAVALVSSHVFLDAMAAYDPREGRRFGVPLLYPFSRWEFLMPLQVFTPYALKHGIHPLLGHILSRDFWTGGIFSEIMGSAMFFTLWVGITLGYDFVTRRTPETVAEPLPQENENPAA